MGGCRTRDLDSILGKNKSIKRILLKWSIAVEKRWPGLLYVGTSRGKKLPCLALDCNISWLELHNLGVNKMKCNLFLKGQAQGVEMLERGHGTKSDFVKMILCLCETSQANIASMPDVPAETNDIARPDN